MNHPASTTAASGGLSAAAVVILMWLLSLVHIDMPADVAAAFGIIVTAALGYVMHGRIALSESTTDPRAGNTAVPPTKTE